ncbi:MAG: exo-beta-N-acetylmuramidase NamZ domain-containing protein, partial [Myxococcota bacterium]
MTRVVTGLERLRTEPELQKLLSGRRVGLLAHAASIDADFRHAKDIVAELGDLRVLFGPEHGFAADAQDMEPVEEDGEASGMAPSSGASSSGASSSGASSSGASASGVSSSGASSSGVSSSSSSPRVISLYGTYPEDLSPRQEHLEDLDVLVVDLQDVGSRYYTYVWTAAFALRACARAGVHVVVLDRPNPIGGVVREGAPQR